MLNSKGEWARAKHRRLAVVADQGGDTLSKGKVQQVRPWPIPKVRPCQVGSWQSQWHKPSEYPARLMVVGLGGTAQRPWNQGQLRVALPIDVDSIILFDCLLLQYQPARAGCDIIGRGGRAKIVGPFLSFSFDIFIGISNFPTINILHAQPAPPLALYKLAAEDAHKGKIYTADLNPLIF